MSKVIQDSVARLPAKLSNSQAGKSLQLLARDVAAPSSTQTGQQSCENLVLKALVESLLFKMLSSDAVFMAVRRAMDNCDTLGIPEEEYKPLLQSVLKGSEKVRGKNWLSVLF